MSCSGLCLGLCVLLLGACTFDEQELKVYPCNDDHPECPAGQTCNGTTCVKTGATDTGKPDMPLDGAADKGPDPDGVKPDQAQPDGPVADGPVTDGPEVDKLIPDMPPVDFPWAPDQPVVDLQPPDVLPPADGACAPTTTRSCYTGAQGTNGVGECKSGTQTCTTGMAWGPCIGEVTPVSETCDGKDNNCDNVKDNGTGFTCVLSTTQNCPTSCSSIGTQTCTTSCTWGACQPPAEVCNGVDDDCDGAADNGFPCKKGVADFCTTTCGTAGSRTCNVSCVWGVCTATEQCNGLDDDCDGVIDNGLFNKAFYKDGDNDTFGDPNTTIQACAAPPGYVSDSQDCYDANPNANPNQGTYQPTDRGDGSYDWNCDGTADKKYKTQQMCVGSPPTCGMANAYCSSYSTIPGCGLKFKASTCNDNTCVEECENFPSTTQLCL